MTVVEYNVVTSQDAMFLDEYVKQAIDMGWQPLGGVSCSNAINSKDEETFYLAQAMVKYDR